MNENGVQWKIQFILLRWLQLSADQLFWLGSVSEFYGRNLALRAEEPNFESFFNVFY